MTDVTTLGQLAADGRLVFNDGYRTKQAELGEPGIPILRVAEVLDGTIVPALGDQIREEYRSVIGAKASQLGDVVVTTKGTVGRVAQIREGMTQFVYAPQLCFFRATSTSGVDAGFLYQWFRGREFRDQAAGVQSQTDMAPYINLSDLRAMTISLPPLAEQRAIADILGALDDKIEANRRVGTRLTDMLQSLFLNICRPLQTSAPLLGLSELTKGVSYRSVDLAPSETAMVTLKSVDRHGGYKPDGLKPYVGSFEQSQVLAPGELAVAQTDLTQAAEVVGRAIRVPRSPLFKTLVASLDLLIVRSRRAVPGEYLFAVLLQESFRQHCRRHTSGTTVLHLASDALERYQVPDVVEGAQVKFAKAARPLLELSDTLGREVAILVALRDAVLPELLSGRLRTPAARERIEAVV